MTSDLLRALAGGTLIGGAAGLFLLVNGRILGVSGLVGLVLRGRPGQGYENLLLLAGLPAGAALLSLWWPLTDVRAIPTFRVMVAGFLVGIGVRLANGCTSGHAVCGIARGARRSFAATAVFMVTAIATVAVMGRLP